MEILTGNQRLETVAGLPLFSSWTAVHDEQVHDSRPRMVACSRRFDIEKEKESEKDGQTVLGRVSLINSVHPRGLSALSRCDLSCQCGRKPHDWYVTEFVVTSYFRTWIASGCPPMSKVIISPNWKKILSESLLFFFFLEGGDIDGAWWEFWEEKRKNVDNLFVVMWSCRCREGWGG